MIVINSSTGNFITMEDRTYSCFAGNNYLGLANHPEVIKDVIEAVQKYGVNFSASRQTTGTSDLHIQLEKLLADFHAKPASIVFPSGYSGNRILLNTLRDRYSAVFYDELSHPSIIEGFPADVTNRFKYRHLDAGHLELLLKQHSKFRPLIITDGIFALTGELAPLDRIHSLVLEYHATLIVDEAHATGILGANGRGTAEHFNIIDSPVVFQSGTMSKALGAYGGFISSDEETINLIREYSAPYLASTALPPPIVSAACSALKICMSQPELRNLVINNAQIVREGLRECGFTAEHSKTPIIPLAFSTEKKAEGFSLFLKENNIIVPYVKYPVKIDKFIARITASAIHTRDQMDHLVDVIKKWREKYGIGQD